MEKGNQKTAKKNTVKGKKVEPNVQKTEWDEKKRLAREAKQKKKEWQRQRNLALEKKKKAAAQPEEKGKGKPAKKGIKKKPPKKMNEKTKNKEQPPRTFLYALQCANRTTLERLMIELALRTNVTGESAIIHDICALSEVPALPDIFVSQKKSNVNLEQDNLFFTTAAGAAGHHYR
ncbi:hypothetical protein AGDE_14487 [Angomonas deanei]|nr:hypothetical protein AGDE_14487 [Angomonas deanei]|eukprot:EPY20768.1 hypothetical protein AGDE_14487 [Angomonas deanei]